MGAVVSLFSCSQLFPFDQRNSGGGDGGGGTMVIGARTGRRDVLLSALPDSCHAVGVRQFCLLFFAVVLLLPIDDVRAWRQDFSAPLSEGQLTIYDPRLVNCQG